MIFNKIVKTSYKLSYTYTPLRLTHAICSIPWKCCTILAHFHQYVISTIKSLFYPITILSSKQKVHTVYWLILRIYFYLFIHHIQFGKYYSNGIAWLHFFYMGSSAATFNGWGDRSILAYVLGFLNRFKWKRTFLQNRYSNEKNI